MMRKERLLIYLNSGGGGDAPTQGAPFDDKYGEPLMQAMENKATAVAPIELRDDNFEAEVMNGDLPVLVDFWAPWCAPCRAVAPVIEALAGEFAGRAKVGKLNVDENQGVAGALQIMSIPTVALIKGNQVLAHRVGALGLEDYRAMIESALENQG